jgi:hypothetical protein
MSTFSRRDFIATLSAVGLSPAALAHGGGDNGGWGDGSKPQFLHGVSDPGHPLSFRPFLL